MAEQSENKCDKEEDYVHNDVETIYSAESVVDFSGHKFLEQKAKVRNCMISNKKKNQTLHDFMKKTLDATRIIDPIQSQFRTTNTKISTNQNLNTIGSNSSSLNEIL